MAIAGEIKVPVRVSYENESSTGSTLKDLLYAYLRSKGCTGPIYREEAGPELWTCPTLAGMRQFTQVVECVIAQELQEAERRAEPVRASLF